MLAKNAFQGGLQLFRCIVLPIEGDKFALWVDQVHDDRMINEIVLVIIISCSGVVNSVLPCSLLDLSTARVSQSKRLSQSNAKTTLPSSQSRAKSRATCNDDATLAQTAQKRIWQAHRSHLINRASEADHARIELLDILSDLRNRIPLRVNGDEHWLDLLGLITCKPLANVSRHLLHCPSCI